MNIAEMFVRIRGDVSDAQTKIASLEAKIVSLENAGKRLNNSLGETHLKTGRLGNQFANLAGQIARVHPIVGNLANVLGDFALGAGVTVGVLAGVAAIAVAYDKLTEATRKATKEQDDLIASLEKAIHLRAMGPGGETIDQTDAARKRAAAIQTQIQTLDKLLVKDALDADALASNAIIQRKINDLVAERERLLNDVASGEKIIDEKIAAATPKIHSATAAVKKFSDATGEAVTNWRDLVDLWESLLANRNAGQDLTNALMKSTFADFMEVPSVSMPNVGLSDSLTSEQKKQREKMGIFIEDANKNADKVYSAIWGAALQSAQLIVSALNVGGGGRGSQIGASLGSILGAGLTVGAGVLTSGIWGVVGGVVGSVFGGLFDHHKKAVNANTDAVNRNTAALLLNAPAGFRVGSYAYGATATGGADVEAYATAARRRAARGGTVPV